MAHGQTCKHCYRPYEKHHDTRPNGGSERCGGCKPGFEPMLGVGVSYAADDSNVADVISEMITVAIDIASSWND